MPRWLALVLVFLACGCAAAQDVAFRGRVDVIHHSKHKAGSADVVVWLSAARSAANTAANTAANVAPAPIARLVQKDKRFSPHVIAIRVGSEIEFPNQDPFFHDVFSIYRGKPFDLGLYESGSSRKVRFTQPGVSYIFCNIHPEMSAAVIAVPTPYFAVTASDGSFRINHLPAGRYKLEFWYELASEAELAALAREVEIGADGAPVTVTLHSSDISAPHLNKYGQEYSPEKPKSY
jgi:plastocyanin